MTSLDELAALLESNDVEGQFCGLIETMNGGTNRVPSEAESSGGDFDCATALAA